MAVCRSTGKVSLLAHPSYTHTADSASSPDLEPTTYHNPYTPESTQDSVPPAPKPYSTYDGPEWMIQDQAEYWKM